MSSSPMSPTMFNIKDLGRDTWTSVMDILALFQELGSPAGKEAVGVFMEKYSDFLAEVDHEAAALNAKLAQIPILEAALEEANNRDDHAKSASAEKNGNISDLQKKVKDMEAALSRQQERAISCRVFSDNKIGALRKKVDGLETNLAKETKRSDDYRDSWESQCRTTAERDKEIVSLKSELAKEKRQLEISRNIVRKREIFFSDQAGEITEITDASKAILATSQEGVDHKASTVATTSKKVKSSEE
ncbi:uncharacterized protein B0J16DRAFT_324449 [Fusarium flagelliforme]|uniref:uncharacterized protein n=1 Tax=Fusarium flagelliforme TaxID=2675880 RepID=UPI001E8DCF0D|nr:uncharacterized protein B0J16DRAFT_324449 [Fusarium flagelliforme]KAH7174998.1 hypothetical protein B0J16DRAFT_324449 [Fusarium flagelliforme]